MGKCIIIEKITSKGGGGKWKCPKPGPYNRLLLVKASGLMYMKYFLWWDAGNCATPAAPNADREENPESKRLSSHKMLWNKAVQSFDRIWADIDWTLQTEWSFSSLETRWIFQDEVNECSGCWLYKGSVEFLKFQPPEFSGNFNGFILMSHPCFLQIRIEIKLWEYALARTKLLYSCKISAPLDYEALFLTAFILFRYESTFVFKA